MWEVWENLGIVGTTASDSKADSDGDGDIEKDKRKRFRNYPEPYNLVSYKA